MKKIVGTVLIVLAIYLGYTGVTKLNKSGESVEILGAELSVADNQKKNTSYLLIGFSALSLLGGIYLIGKGK